MSPVTQAFAPALVVCQLAGGGRGDGGGAGGHGRLGWCPADPGHGMADAARADARLGGLGRRCAPPGGAGHQAAAARSGRRGSMTGEDQHHPAGEGGGASYRPQCQVGLMPGQRVRPPSAGRSPVPRHVTGTLAHIPSPPRDQGPRATVAAAHRVIAPVQGHIIPPRPRAACGLVRRRQRHLHDHRRRRLLAVAAGTQTVVVSTSAIAGPDSSRGISRGSAIVRAVAGLLVLVPGSACDRYCTRIGSRARVRLPSAASPGCAGRGNGRLWLRCSSSPPHRHRAAR